MSCSMCHQDLLTSDADQSLQNVSLARKPPGLTKLAPEVQEGILLGRAVTRFHYWAMAQVPLIYALDAFDLWSTFSL